MKKHWTTFYKVIETLIYIAGICFGVWMLSWGARMLYTIWKAIIN